MNQIHPSAIVDPGASLGENVQVGPFAIIEAGVEVGDGVCVGPHAVIMRGVTLGARCDVHAGAVIGDQPQDLAFKGGRSFVRIGADAVIREMATIHRGTAEGSETVIGDSCFVMGNVHIAHNVVLGKRVIIVNGALLGGYVQVADGAFISGNVQIHQFCRVGRLAMLGGGASVTQDVPPFCTVHSGRFNELAGLNIVGLRRAGLSPEERLALKKAYRNLFCSGTALKESLQTLREAKMGPAVEELLAFVEQSRRGVMRPVRGRESVPDAE